MNSNLTQTFYASVLIAKHACLFPQSSNLSSFKAVQSLISQCTVRKIITFNQMLREAKQSSP